MLLMKITKEGLEKVKEKFNKKYRYIGPILKNVFRLKCRCSSLGYYSFDKMIQAGIKKQKFAGSASIKINKCPVCMRYYLTKKIDKKAERIFGA